MSFLSILLGRCALIVMVKTNKILEILNVFEWSSNMTNKICMMISFVCVWGGSSCEIRWYQYHPKLCLTSVGSKFEAAVEYYNITAHLSPGVLIHDIYRLYNIHRRSYATVVGQHWKCLSPVWSNCLQARSRHYVAVASKYLRDNNDNNNANIRPFIRNHYTAQSLSNVINIKCSSIDNLLPYRVKKMFFHKSHKTTVLDRARWT